MNGNLVQTQGRNIKSYAEYLVQRVSSYASTKVDFVRAGEGRLTRLSVDKGLLRETESVQEMIRALLRCDVWRSGNHERGTEADTGTSS
jgi:hypothetical protein